MKWKTETKKIQDLEFYDKNPRTINETNAEDLRNSIERFGLCELIVVNTNNVIIGGHQRVRIMRELGYTEAEVLVPDSELTEKEVSELNIRLNKIDGDWDDDILANLWDPSDLIEFGFTADDLGIDLATKKEKKKKIKLTLEFIDQNDLQEALPKLQPIMESLDNCKFKVSM
jgi:ParB-like chromosome segregation protein Spo0J